LVGPAFLKQDLLNAAPLLGTFTVACLVQFNGFPGCMGDGFGSHLIEQLTRE
jgi:hypothetical protein